MSLRTWFREHIAGSGHRHKDAGPLMVKGSATFYPPAGGDWGDIGAHPPLPLTNKPHWQAWEEAMRNAKPGSVVPVDSRDWPRIIAAIDRGHPGGDMTVVARREGGHVVDFTVVDEVSDVPEGMWQAWDRASDDHSCPTRRYVPRETHAVLHARVVAHVMGVRRARQLYPAGFVPPINRKPN